MRAAERKQAEMYLEMLKGDPEVEAIREKLVKTSNLSKRDQKILASLAEKRKAA